MNDLVFVTGEKYLTPGSLKSVGTGRTAKLTASFCAVGNSSVMNALCRRLVFLRNLLAETDLIFFLFSWMVLRVPLENMCQNCQKFMV